MKEVIGIIAVGFVILWYVLFVIVQIGEAWENRREWKDYVPWNWEWRGIIASLVVITVILMAMALAE